MILRFFRSEPAAGIVLFAAAALALVVANSPLRHLYEDVLHHSAGPLSMHLWINDGLMAIFFLQVGLEIKREMIEGELSSWKSRALPGLAAMGGMIAPAIIFVIVNRNNAEHLGGWAIPGATDIAFAIGVLTLLGPRVPPALRVLLVSIAIMDDLGAILIIALFYTDSLEWRWLAAAFALWWVCQALNLLGVKRILPYLAVGVLLWICVYQSGIHATLAGILVALTIPSQARGWSPIQTLELRLDRWVSFLIVPLFGFANAGLAFGGLGRDDLMGSLPVGIAIGLVLGKQMGVMGAIILAIRLRIAVRPTGVSWGQMYGMAMLCGIGFTMSLFIGGLAFDDAPHLIDQTKLGVLSGSIIAATLGALVLRFTLREKHPRQNIVRPGRIHRKSA